MTNREIAIIEHYFHEVFDKRQQADEIGNVRDYDYYNGQMDAIEELEDRLGINSSKFWQEQ